jgi:hypothetical protein
VSQIGCLAKKKEAAVITNGGGDAHELGFWGCLGQWGRPTPAIEGAWGSYVVVQNAFKAVGGRLAPGGAGGGEEEGGRRSHRPER